MKTRTIALTLMFCLVAAGMAFAKDWNQGTWKLNESKSKIAAGSPKNLKVVYSMDGAKVKCVVDGVDGAGKATHNEWIGMYDGNDYAVKGDPTADTRSLKKVSDSRYDLTNKKGGKTTVTGTVEFSPDGKTRTLTTWSTDASGKKVENVAVYERQ